jgi:soluble lytic murein transglycosylase-like protein
MIKHILATVTGLLFFGGTVSTAKAPPPKPIQAMQAVEYQVREAIPAPPIPAEARHPEWWALAREVGWEEDQMLTLDYVIHRESRGQTGAFNKSDPNGGSVCLLQINKFWVKYLRQHNVIKQAEDLYDPRTCLTAGLTIYRYGIERHGWGWGPWAIKQP